VTVDKSSTGTSAAGSGGSTSASTTGSGLGGTSTTAASGGAGGVPLCPSGPNDDKDKDGFTVAEGDCNDCDPIVNPAAIEIITADPAPGDGGAPVPVDEDCDGLVDNLAPFCDTGLALANADPLNAVRAMDLCKLSTGPKSWGIVSAAWVLADDKPLPKNPTQLANYHLGHGILSDFGPNNTPLLGKSLLALSTGTARRPTDPGYQDVVGFDKGYPGMVSLFSQGSPTCPGVVSTSPRDAVGLEIRIIAPVNAYGFRFYSSVFSRSWPERVCSAFDDTFLVLQSPVPFGTQPGQPIAIDMLGNKLALNQMYAGACSCAAPPCFAPPAGPTQKPYACELGPSALAGTGFEGSGSTGWLETRKPVEPGKQFTLLFSLWDGEDGLYDTTVLVDGFQWITDLTQVPVSTGSGPPP
jgi:hypothetical protein